MRRFGTRVVIIEPTPEDHDAMGLNWMSSERRGRVIETAQRTVAGQLRRPELRGALEGLPRGAPHMIRRPEGPAASWPRPPARGAA